MEWQLKKRIPKYLTNNYQAGEGMWLRPYQSWPQGQKQVCTRQKLAFTPEPD